MKTKTIKQWLSNCLISRLWNKYVLFEEEFDVWDKEINK